jgi:DNA-binding response OmpR family regulator
MTAAVKGRCPGCARRVVLPDGTHEPGLLGCPACATLFPFPTPAGEGPVVVVAHADEQLLALASAVLDDAGFHPVVAADGEAARAAVADHAPSALLLDAALPGALPFDWIPALRAQADTADLPILLIGSIHDPAAYRRAPVDLHGADDYVDAHAVQTEAVGRIEALLMRHPRRALGPGRSP